MLLLIPVLFAVHGLKVFDKRGDFGVHGTTDQASMSLVMKMGMKVSGESIAKATSSAQSTRVGPVSGLNGTDGARSRSVSFGWRHGRWRWKSKRWC